MIIVASENIKFLKWVYKIPFIKLFFVVKPSRNFPKITDNQILERFYNEVYVSTKTAKTTTQHRFRDLDKKTTAMLPHNQKTKCHDVAVSSGITSLDFYEACKLANINIELFVSDKYAQINISENKIIRIFDQDNMLMLAVWKNFMAMDRNKKAPLSILLFRIIKKFTKVPPTFDYALWLFHPSLMQQISKKNIHSTNYDIFETKTDQKFDFVRCMNILNKVYFKTEMIKKAILNIWTSINTNGILLVGRTLMNGENHASFFRKTKSGFELIDDFGNGSEIKAIILQISK